MMDCFNNEPIFCYVIISNKKEKKKENRMGTACICYKQQKQSIQLIPLQQAQLQLSSEKGKSYSTKGKHRFVDIKNEANCQEDLSQLDLNIINNELSRYLIEFQLKNGAITNRFTQRILNEDPKFQENIGNMMEGEENKENVVQSHKDNELYLPLTGENIDEDVQPSFVSENEEGKTNNKSCLLSLSSHILHDSLFTERAQKKQIFYRQFSNIGAIILSKWNDNNRLNYTYTLDDIAQLKVSHFDSKFITALTCIHQYWQSHFIHLLTYSEQPLGLKVYMNGDMKMFPLYSMNNNLSLLDLYTITNEVKDLDISELIYFLTGWMPEHIYLSDIKNFAGILERLANNLNQGNTLITFSRQTKFGKEYASLASIDFDNGLLTLASNNSKTTIPDFLLEHKNLLTNEVTIRFQHFIELYDVINLNWNPFIYDLNQACEGIIHNEKQVKKFLLVIPPSSQDLEIRLFFQRHLDYSKLNKLGVTINLYEYEGLDDISQMQPIRTIQTCEPIYSDVFIFQYCKEKTQYLLTLTVNQTESLTTDLFFTITLYSFAEMKFKELQKKPCLIQTRINTQISEDNIGYGINSPYFNKNLQFSVDTQIGKQLQVNVTASKNHVYQICLIPDPQKESNLTKLKLENIINNSQISAEKKGRGSFFVKTAFKHYLLMINTYSCVQEHVDIELRLYGKESSAIEEHTLKIHQILDTFKPAYTQQVKWLPTHSGPRKRLKSNSVNSFQPAQTFTQFFKNPVIDKKLVKGTYQFFIKSQTFREYFDSVQNNEDKNSCQPPALSMAIFLASEDKKSFKIIADDAFYVPFGVGFWTCSIEMQEGNYRFVLPKMDKGFSKGLFGVIKN